jgi:acyl dehydratase
VPINPDALGAAAPPVESSWTSTDCLLYALGVGAGALDPACELEFTTEHSAAHPQRVLPTFATVVGRPRGPDGASTGGAPLGQVGDFDPAMLVHGEQAIQLDGPLPTEGRVRTSSRVAGIYDKGSGALIVIESESSDADTGQRRFCAATGLFVRGEGGFGGPRGPSEPDAGPPARAPDHVVSYTTRPDQALLYRLSGDRNPLHSDPDFAKRAGFPRPILHGLCTYGFTGRALLHTLCGSDPARFGSMTARFSAPAYPGDTLAVSIWTDHDRAWFRTETQSGAVVLDRGQFRLR